MRWSLRSTIQVTWRCFKSDSDFGSGRFLSRPYIQNTNATVAMVRSRPENPRIVPHLRMRTHSARFFFGGGADFLPPVPFARSFAPGSLPRGGDEGVGPDCAHILTVGMRLV